MQSRLSSPKEVLMHHLSKTLNLILDRRDSLSERSRPFNNKLAHQTKCTAYANAEKYFDMG